MTQQDESKNNTSTRKVTFVDEPNVISTLEPMSAEEYQERWYTTNDLAAMRSTNDSTTDRNNEAQTESSAAAVDNAVTTATTTAFSAAAAAAVVATTNDEMPTCCEYGRLSSQQRRAFVTSLLEQQYEHQQLGFQDPKGLFQFSRAASKQSRLRAIRIAEDDAKYAQEVMSCEELAGTIDAVLDLMNEDLDFTT